MVKVSRIERKSIADELGIQPGTELLAVNGRPLADFLDWEFLTADEELVIQARQPNGEEVIYELEEGTVPPEVAINEAVVLAKRYATDEAARLVNGILARVAREEAAA